MLYPEMNPMELEPHYCRHVEAMTAEGLHEKSDIATQLAWRDAKIEALSAALLRGATAPAYDIGYTKGQADALAERWVLTSERLPEERKPVMVDGGPAYWTGRYWLTMVEEPHRIIQWKVTRWCELPTPPASARGEGGRVEG